MALKATAKRRARTSRSSAATNDGAPMPVVGIGASAGGLEALKAFFGAMPPTTGLAFVVVVHLDPTHDSLMPELIARATAHHVEHARDRQALEADHVYIIPPNRTLILERGRLRVRTVPDRRSLRGVIDQFYRSLAGDQHDRAVAVILSGTGTEGTLGLQAVKAEGGMVMAQTPDTASQPGMPASAIATGLVDVVLPPGEMPKVMLEYLRTAGHHRAAASPTVGKPLGGLAAILTLLRARTKYDFRGYKKGTLERRIERRMALHHRKSVGHYVDYLRGHPEEADQLFRDLLIGVTSFFRDPSAFEELTTRVLGTLVKEKDGDAPIRIWVPGCATGEEAYSIAIAAAEQVAAARSSRRIQVFATDVDEDALDVARGGVYPESIALDVTPERLARFFTHDEHHYTILKSIRESIVFAVQNVIGDPPFSKLDLVSCRNVLIYLEPAVQGNVIAVFHFALNPSGFLFLGSAESTGPLAQWFAPVSKRARIFRRLGGKSAPLGLPVAAASVDAAPLGATPTSEGTVAALANHGLLEHFAPAAVVVRRTGQIVHFFGSLSRYINLPSGEATLDVLRLARDPLKPRLRAALHEAIRQNRLTVLDTTEIKADRTGATLRITVRPLDGPSSAERLWMIVFESLESGAGPSAPRTKGKAQALVRRLETELRVTKKEQQQLIEQFESSSEELKAANEEVRSMNEELQSTNEELVTSREELQSMNEELSTLNAQLQEKVQEVTAVRDDLANLLVSTDIATVFVDRECRIRRFTNAATRLLHLLPSDVGRPINHVATNLVNVDLSQEARAVLGSLAPIEREVDAQDGCHYIFRALPYRSGAHVVEGVVLTLSDVTSLKTTQSELVAAKETVSGDLRRMSRLHGVSTRLAGSEDLPTMLDEIVRAAKEMAGSDMASVQLSDSTGALTIAAQIGFEPSFHDFPGRVRFDVGTAVGAAPAARRRIIVDDVMKRAAFGEAASLNALQTAGVRSMQSTPLVGSSGELVGVLSTYQRAPTRFDDAELRWLDLLARQATDLIERRRLENARSRVSDELEERVQERTKRLTLMHDVSQAIDQAPTWTEALQRVIRLICVAGDWQAGCVYVPAVDAPDQLVAAVSYSAGERAQPFVEASKRMRHARGQTVPGRFLDAGPHVWVNDRDALLALMPERADAAAQAGLQSVVALPVRVGHDTLAVVELCSDRPHAQQDELVRLMQDVSAQLGRVLERERIMAQVGDIIWGEQQDLVHTLHDTLGQQLTGLGMLAASVNQRLKATDSETAHTAQQIASTAQEALEHVRRLSRGLAPADIDRDAFVAAIRELASTTESLHKIPCSVECETPITLPTSRVATQLFRIAQEAVTNALRHAKASRIAIRVRAEAGTTTLMVIDDGVGIPHSETPTGGGTGLRIMRHRAGSMGAVITVGPGADGGTVVKCMR
jgi:two-component system, chemotaxis family, CheB/CheR fusion protein